MNEAEMQKALGLLIDVLSDVAWDCQEMTGAGAQELLEKSRLIMLVEANEEQASALDVDVGDEIYILTPFASHCVKMSRQ